jgi:hypothetical protein
VVSHITFPTREHFFANPLSELRPHARSRGLDHIGRQSERRTMRVAFSSSCAIGLAFGLLLGATPTARAQQPRRATSTTRIKVRKDRPAEPLPAPVAAPRVNQDSINAAERARQDSIAAAEREMQMQDQRSRQDQARRDSIQLADRHRQDSITVADQARQDSINRARARAQSDEALREARRHNSGFYMGIAGGSTLPWSGLRDAVNNSYKIGWNVTVPFGVDFGPLGLRFDVAMDNLPGKDNFFDSGANPTTPRTVAIYSGSGGLKLNLPIFRTASRLYLMGGAGAHRITGYATSAVGSDSAMTIQNAKTNVGWYGGAGLNFRFGRSALFVESRYVNINANAPTGFAYQKANYIPIILGFQF